MVAALLALLPAWVELTAWYHTRRLPPNDSHEPGLSLAIGLTLLTVAVLCGAAALVPARQRRAMWVALVAALVPAAAVLFMVGDFLLEILRS